MGLTAGAGRNPVFRERLPELLALLLLLLIVILTGLDFFF
jgi:hypothetical protein